MQLLFLFRKSENSEKKTKKFENRYFAGCISCGSSSVSLGLVVLGFDKFYFDPRLNDWEYNV